MAEFTDLIAENATLLADYHVTIQSPEIPMEVLSLHRVSDDYSISEKIGYGDDSESDFYDSDVLESNFLGFLNSSSDRKAMATFLHSLHKWYRVYHMLKINIQSGLSWTYILEPLSLETVGGYLFHIEKDDSSPKNEEEALEVLLPYDPKHFTTAPSTKLWKRNERICDAIDELCNTDKEDRFWNISHRDRHHQFHTLKEHLQACRQEVLVVNLQLLPKVFRNTIVNVAKQGKNVLIEDFMTRDSGTVACLTKGSGNVMLKDDPDVKLHITVDQYVNPHAVLEYLKWKDEVKIVVYHVSKNMTFLDLEEFRHIVEKVHTRVFDKPLIVFAECERSDIIQDMVKSCNVPLCFTYNGLQRIIDDIKQTVGDIVKIDIEELE